MTKVLIADDDDAILDSLSLALEDEGYEIRTVSDETILDIIRSFEPDVVLLDIWYGNLHGGDLCKQIKSDKNLRQAHVIMMSTGRDTAEIAAASGADDYLMKPLDIDELSAKLHDLAIR